MDVSWPWFFWQVRDKEQGVMSLSVYMAADALISLVPGKGYDTLILEDWHVGSKHVLRLASHVRPHPKFESES
ncbi:hypothetical protein BN1708_007273 [Verticillium longisporum]|uniref:Uncharacterized protein n=1 Tax=Verticillium longisporum TaxID=100787 RepID=A0A0G4MRZ0_VERLO|nr:hypothetical protein BN1708_007273 [Verticillium longisporum]